MMQIKLCGDLVLREKCEEVKEITEDIKSSLDEMVIIMNNQNGVGLAAPQVGITKRFIIIMNPDTREIYKMINPKITYKSDKFCSMEEGCLSILGNDGLPIYSYVSRPEFISVSYLTENGEKKEDNFNGILARIAQHEIDHLDGILFIDYLSGIRRTMLMKKVKKAK